MFRNCFCAPRVSALFSRRACVPSVVCRLSALWVLTGYVRSSWFLFSFPLWFLWLFSLLPLASYSLANTPLVGTTLACTLLFGTTLTSTRLVGTTLAGTTLAGITLATTAHTGTALAGGTVSGTTPVDPTPTGTTSPGDTPPGCPVAGCSACSQPPRIRGWGRAKTGGAAEGVKDSWGPSASASPYQRARRLPIGWGEQNTKNSSCA